MSLSSDLAQYFATLEAASGPARLYRPDILRTLPKTADFQSFNASLQKLKPEERLLVLLRTLASQKSALAPQLLDAELVVTFPGSDSISARHTLHVLRQMLASAKREVLVAGFAITQEGGLLPLLVEAARRGLKILLVCSNWKDSRGNTAVTLIDEQWPTNVLRPDIHEYNNNPGTGAGMHIKCVLVDGTDILIGSANFTFFGLNRNFEMGIRINGHIAQTARAVFDEFLQTGRFKQTK